MQKNEYYDTLLEPLTRWFYDRTFDSGHLIGGPTIGFFRFENQIKIYWNSDYLLADGGSIWKYPKGIYEIQYSDFILEVVKLFQQFTTDMDAQVHSDERLNSDWSKVKKLFNKMISEIQEE